MNTHRKSPTRCRFGRSACVSTLVFACALAIALVLGLPLTAQGDVDLARVAKTLKAADLGARTDAIVQAVTSRRPEALEVLRFALLHTLKTHAKLHAKYVRLGKEIQSETNARDHLDKPVNNRPKIAELQKARQGLAVRVEREEKVLDALKDGVARLHASLEPADREAAVAAFLRSLRKARKTKARSTLLEVLGRMKDAAARDALVASVPSRDPELRITAIEALGRQGDPAAVETIAKALDDPFWQVRVTAIDALAAIGGKDAVTALIIFVGKAEGRLIEDVTIALEKLTGQNFRDNKVLWRDWWMKAKADYDGPPKPKGMGQSGETGEAARRRAWRERGGGSSFYGIHTRSKRVVYILDISNSMNAALDAEDPARTRRPVVHAPEGERRIDQAVEELVNAITALPDDATFNIVFYNHEVDAWKKKQVAAKASNKKRAVGWARKVVADGNTNIFDALKRAFRLAGRGTFDKGYKIAADTIYLMSDGRANRGDIVDPGEMVAEVNRMNKFRKVVIHAIAVGDGADVAFMRQLARNANGQFVHHTSTGRK